MLGPLKTPASLELNLSSDVVNWASSSRTQPSLPAGVEEPIRSRHGPGAPDSGSVLSYQRNMGKAKALNFDPRRPRPGEQIR